MKRSFAVLIVALSLTIGLIAIAPKPSRITWSNYLMIKDGMTEVEVRAILGRETRSYPALEQSGIVPSDKAMLVRRCALWYANDSHIQVGYDKDDNVQWKIYMDR